LKNQTLVINQRDEQLRQVTTESFDVPDGKVLWVNNRLGTAYVNLGSADGLRSQVTFSVYAVDANNLARQEKKGSIEITRVVNDHMAEGKITSDKISDPILTGDVVFTPLWNARSALHFGLVGFMDIDGDGRNDRALIKRLIQLNNGTVDIEDAGGEVVGSITSHTRYLIRGDEPAVGDTEEETSSQAAQDAWSKIIKEANSFGVEQMSVEKLLDYIGYDGEKRTIPLGTAARPDDFQPKNGPPHGQGSVFRERVPR
ncbi:MAG: hypothetical protein KDA92_25630, partial [Planctomycetales bacterium]|nr:hypothetical protein [Planctomycetales bacterium]